MTGSFHDRKASDSLLAPYERHLANVMARVVPHRVKSHHLTLLSVVWVLLILLAGVFAKSDRRWLWVASLVILLQYVTDAVDGKIGKMRNENLVRWGYYMDHFLDYAFLCAILIGYSMLLPPESQYLMTLVLAVSGGFMASAFLAKAVNGVLRISCVGVGPVEIRIVFIAINTWIVTAGHADMVAVIPYVLACALIVLTWLVFDTQRALWLLDRQTAGSPANAELRVITYDRAAAKAAGLRTRT